MRDEDARQREILIDVVELHNGNRARCDCGDDIVMRDLDILQDRSHARGKHNSEEKHFVVGVWD
jgi:hypothetical protein